MTVHPTMEGSSLIQPISVKSLSSHLKSPLGCAGFQGETTLATDGNADFDPMRARAYCGVDQSNCGVPFFVNRTDVELQFNRENGEETRRREPAEPLAGKRGNVKPGKALSNTHHDMPLCTLQEVDGSKPERNEAPFRKMYVMDAVQEKDDSLVLYCNASFQQNRAWPTGISTCHSLKNAPNDREHRGLDKADTFMNGAATSGSTAIRGCINGLRREPVTDLVEEEELMAALASPELLASITDYHKETKSSKMAKRYKEMREAGIGEVNHPSS